ncbi:MAG: hypothetical protein P8L28_08810 [Flavobacteriaceae bacterium]|nr:hypothetical protein [Flavobacteriaceae bacterium]
MTAKQKNIGLVVGFCSILFIAYQFSFKKTIEVKSNLKQLAIEQKLFSNAITRSNYLQQENTYLDSILASSNISINKSFEHYFIEKITDLKELYKVTLISYEKPHTFKFDGATMLSYSIEIKGEFRNLMLFTSSLEQLQMGEFAVVSFEKKKNYSTRKEELYCKLILQKLSK